MRIPITIKIPVNVVRESDGLGLVNVVINDISNGLENISVRLLNRKPTGSKLTKAKPAVGGEIRRSSPTRFPVVFNPKTYAHPAPAITNPAPRLRYTVKTIHITLTWPTLPTLAELRHLLTHLPRRVWLRAAVAAAAVAIVVVGINLLGSPGSNNPAATTAKLPQLTKGTPSYSTLLPAGKTISQLGGWTRISPPGKNPVYTYIDKIGTVQINVSEQPLPANFTADPTTSVAQLAQGFNATNKFMADKSTTVYVASSPQGDQSVILTKNNLLILIKSSATLNNTQWATYISSLQ